MCNDNIPDTDLAWLAGFIDGEGYIGIIRSKKHVTRQTSDSWLYHPWIVVTSTEKNIIQDIQDIVGGGKWAFLRRTEGQKPGYQIKITKQDLIIEILGKIEKYLKIKNRQAQLLIEFCMLRKNAIIITGRKSRGMSSFGERENEIYLELKKLNKRGV